ncbi:hypothetical protein EDM80_06850 [bacterium]|nr:MAG: hypothetical protein EDM80_06850 [bacterium]RIK63894.1 MAG: hypothetical protein DCC64_05660 [Planctomycetota bacterium]
MGLGDFFRRLFGRGGDPDAEAPVDKAAMREELDRYDELITRNEVELRKVMQELQRLELQEKAQADALKAGKIGEQEKEVVLLSVKRNRTRIESLKHRIHVYNKNIEVLQSMVDKHQTIAAMNLRGIENQMVERLAMDFDERKDKYMESIETANAMKGTDTGILSLAEKEDLKKLERELLGARPAEEKPQRAPNVNEGVETAKKPRERELSEAEVEAEMAKLESEMAQREKDLKAAEVKERPQTE